MRLETAENILSAIGFDGNSTIDPLLEQALDSATVSLQSLIRQPCLLRKSVTDHFAVSNSTRTLNLSNGFVLPASISVRRGSNIASLRDEPVPITTDEYFSEEGKGRVQFLKRRTSSEVISVTYVCGFEKDDENEEYFKDVPSWLSSAAIKQSLIWLDSSNPTVRHDDSEAARLAIKQCVMDRDQLIANYVRYFPMGEYPINA